MKHIFLDARFAGRKDGTGRVSYNLTKQIVSLDTQDRFTILLYKEDIFPEIQQKNVTKIISNWAGKSTIRNVWDLCYLPYLLYTEKIDIYYSYEAFSCPVFFGRKVILTIHDLIPLVIPNYWKKLLNRYWFYFRVWVATRQVHETVTVSQFSKNEIERFFPILKGHIHVVYNALHEDFVQNPFLKNDSIEKYTLKDKGYFLALGGLEKRKNNALTINAFIELLKEKKTDKDLVVLGIGNIAYEKVQHATNFVIPKEYEKRIHFLPGVSDTDLKLLLQDAYAFVYASTYEGFGIPMLEPMFYGIPVIALHATSIPEAGGDACIYIENTIPSMKQAMLTLLHDAHIYETLRKKGPLQVKKFSWQQGAQKIIALFTNS